MFQSGQKSGELLTISPMIDFPKIKKKAKLHNLNYR
jgi:hypothetical protein